MDSEKEIWWGIHYLLMDLKSPNMYPLAEINDQIIAVSHFQNNHGVASISINTDPKIRGQGQGYRLIRKFSDFAKESLGLTEIIAVVKANNTQSIKSFIKAGFEEIERLNDEKKIKYKLNFD